MTDKAQAAPVSSFTGRFVGAIQMIGGALEVSFGAGAVAAPTGVSQVGGAILIMHGADTFVAGFESMMTGQIATTRTQRAATAVSKKLGATDTTASYIGTGADIAAGVGPSIAIGAARRLAIVGAERGSTRVIVAYMHRSAFEIGHNAVGVEQGGVTAWAHFAGKAPGAVQMMGHAPGAPKYVLTPLLISAEGAARAHAAQRLLVEAGPQMWSVLGPNCSTTVQFVLREAGIALPTWARTPMLVHLGARMGTEITIFGGSAAAGAGYQGWGRVAPKQEAKPEAKKEARKDPKPKPLPSQGVTYLPMN